MEADDERRALIRSVRQRINALQRSGIGSIPLANWPPVLASPRVSAAPSRSRSPVTQPLTTAPTRRPELITPSPVSVAPAPAPMIRLPEPPARPVESVPSRVDRPAGPPPVAASLFGEPALAPIVPAGERAACLSTLAGEVAVCTRCAELAATRIQTVFGEGSPAARLMFVGEAPGADEDQTGRPFVGKAGALLTDMITKGMGLERSEVFIANVLKSRPPENRKPTPDEIKNCLPYLEQQIAIVRPEFLCLLGGTAALALLETAIPLGKLRGKWHKYRGIPTIVTYHPAALLRNVAWKKDTWADLQTLMRAMGIKPPERRKPGE